MPIPTCLTFTTGTTTRVHSPRPPADGCRGTTSQQGERGVAKYVLSTDQHHGKQRYAEGNSGQHEMRHDQVKASYQVRSNRSDVVS